MKHILGRRDFLKALSASSLFMATKSPLSTLVESLAHAATVPASSNPNRFISIVAAYAPARWALDNFLYPKMGQPFQSNGSVRNAFTHPSQMDKTHLALWEHSYRSDKKIFLPALWGTNIPTASGVSNQPLSSLLRNTLMIRGIDVGADLGHDEGPERIVQPVSAGPGLLGRMADSSSFPIPLIGLAEGRISHGRNAIGSRKGISAVPVLHVLDGNALNPLENLLGRFLKTTTQDPNSMNITNASVATLTEETLRLISEHHKTSIGNEALKQNLANSEKIVKKSIQQIIDQFLPTYLKYKAIISASATPLSGEFNTPGSSDKQTFSLISADHLKAEQIAFQNINFQGKLSYSLAANFAIIEILFCNNMTSAASFGLDQWIYPRGMETRSYGNYSAVPSYFLDEHGIGDALDFGTRISALNFLYRSLLGCIHELKSRLQQVGLWDSTTIYCSSEFGRCGIDALDSFGAGSDHATHASSGIVISGKIKDFIPVGNISKENNRSGSVAANGVKYAGTWGAGKPITLGGASRMITPSIVASSVSDLIGVERLSDAPSLLSAQGDAFVSAVDGDPTNDET